MPSTIHTTVRGLPSVSPTSTEIVAAAPVDGAQLIVIGSGHLIVGPMGLPLAIVWLQVLVWPHWSVASQVRVATKPFPQARLVTVLRTLIEAVPQESLAVGSSKVTLPTPAVFVLLAEQEMIGEVVSIVAMVWLHVLVLPH